MANKKITELTALTSAATDDVLAIVDVSGTAETKKITVSNLSAATCILTQTSTTIANAAVLTMKYDDTPITLVSAEAGKIHVPVSVTLIAVGAGASESSSDDLRMGWDAATSAASDYLMSGRDFMNGVSSGTYSYNLTPTPTSFTVAYPATAVNKPLQLWCNDVFNGGWSMTAYTTYYSITV